MINFTIKTPINRDYKMIFKHFDKSLFLFLAPSNLKLLRFDGSKQNDIIHIAFSFPKGEWISEITYDEETNEHILFIDEGKKLPFGLVKWTHKHYIKNIGTNKSMIIDEISYSAQNLLIQYLLFLPLYLPLYYRKKLYRTYFHSL